MKKLFTTAIFVLFALPFSGFSGENEVEIIYVHGMGGSNEEANFVHISKKIITNNSIKKIKISHYSWNSPSIEIRIAPARVKQGLKKAEEEAKSFSKNIIESLESNKRPYYIVAHSMGAYLTAKAFEEYGKEALNIKGIYFLGASMPRDFELSINIPKRIKIYNYYSEKFDMVLPFFFSYLGKKSGGQVGFDDIERFENFRTTCTHQFKKMGFHRDYSTLAEAITLLILADEDIFIKSGNFRVSPRKVWRGLMSWHDIARYKNVKVKNKYHDILIQQRWNTKNYRLVIPDENGNPFQLLKGRALHKMLKEIHITFPTTENIPNLLSA